VRRMAGFTLVELLVCIAIIALLSAILMPVVATAKRFGTRGVCSSNLAQIGKAIESYASDYDGCYPNCNDPYLWMGRHWRWLLKDYLAFYAEYDVANPKGRDQITGVTNTILACPSDPSPVDKYDKTSYGLSAAFYHTPEQIDSMTTAQLYLTSGPECSTVSVSQVVYPASKAIAADWLGSHTGDNSGWWSWTGSRTHLFADGHVQFLKATAINPAISPHSDVVRTPYPDINLTTNGVHGKDVE